MLVKVKGGNAQFQINITNFNLLRWLIEPQVTSLRRKQN